MMCTHTCSCYPEVEKKAVRLWMCFREAVLDPVLKVRAAISMQAFCIVQKGRSSCITQGLGHLGKELRIGGNASCGVRIE